MVLCVKKGVCYNLKFCAFDWNTVDNKKKTNSGGERVKADCRWQICESKLKCTFFPHFTILQFVFIIIIIIGIYFYHMSVIFYRDSLIYLFSAVEDFNGWIAKESIGQQSEGIFSLSVCVCACAIILVCYTFVYHNNISLWQFERALSF